MRISLRSICAAALVLATLCLVVILNKDNSSYDVTSDISQRQLPSVQKQDVTHSPDDDVLDPALAQNLPQPACDRNDSMVNVTGFASLPQHIKNFLFYRHCRHFPKLLDVPDKCGGPQGSSNVFLLLVIKSSPPNYDRREVLRKTWAEERQHRGRWIRRIFISGVSDTGFERQRLNKMLQLENQQYNDVLQWDFEDTFFNLTLKQVLFMEWMEQRCPGAHFMLNGDDDIFANTDNMVEYLRDLPDDNDGNKHLYVGHLIRWVGPIREKWSKYYVPVQVQESESYPPYCGGGGFILSGYTLRIIYQMSHSIPLLPIDDVYMGMCLEKAGLEPVSHFGVRTAGLPVPSSKVDPYHPCYYREILLVHRFLPHQIYLMWNRINEPNLKCDGSQVS
ncbi:N-acetyllactosaminide beta-1,3-N-acetylglucosaminyltransferase 3 [Clupea harengus]|uniref:Hexosyltransferase n=1 Tax=Clupea harengus TaxID=7950 RepID=A0A6P3WC39_CLUHA|nr:N-acetyllactosaminide beta-1,3-N-acetylglucosaminyltransferase 3 [Clupea harengus]